MRILSDGMLLSIGLCACSGDGVHLPSSNVGVKNRNFFGMVLRKPIGTLLLLYVRGLLDSSMYASGGSGDTLGELLS